MNIKNSLSAMLVGASLVTCIFVNPLAGSGLLLLALILAGD
jgi:hypothetical protein